jgi:hypothetical protein
MTSVFIVVQVPWLRNDPGYVYEDETSVQIHKTFFSKDKAIEWTTKYALESANEHQKIIDRTGTNDNNEFCLWVVDGDDVDEETHFIDIDGYALRIVEQIVD